jgi:riboflavin synthase
MFTGLIEVVGDVSDITPTSSGYRVRIQMPEWLGLVPGDSVAVNGVCLTATRCDEQGMDADVGPETARVTTLGRLQRGQKVNIERSVRADGRFDGHFVQGHVDGTGVVREVRGDGDSHWISIGIPPEFEPFLILRGSVAVDGVSLTVARLSEARFDVMIIPFTWTQTSLSSLGAGDLVNLECDMVGKYVARAIALAARSGATT